MSSRWFLYFQKFIMLCALGWSESLAVAAPRNVVIFISDDHGLDTGAYGNRVIQTPHLDAFSREATRYTQAFATVASCSPSRAVLLTGLQAHANGQFGLMHEEHNSRTHLGVRSLPVILGAGGYHTVRIGKFHLAPEETYRFETVLGAEPADNRDSVQMAELCRNTIADRSRPFFLYFATDDPHRSGFTASGSTSGVNRFGNEKVRSSVTEITYRPEDVIVPPYLPDNAATRAELAQYYQAVSRMDQGFGRLIQILRETGQFENTLILYLSDNGIAMPGAKTNLYDAGIHLPLLVRSPDATQRGIASDAMISWVDITPTILDFAGIHEVLAPRFRPGTVASGASRSVGPAVPYEFHGRSFLPTVDQATNPEWRLVFGSHIFHEIQMYYPMRMIRTDRFKLILNIASPLEFPLAADLYNSATWQHALAEPAEFRFGRRSMTQLRVRPQYELYDLQKDPDEADNVAARPEYRTVFQSLASQLKEYQRTTRDPWLVKYDRQ